ncbi:MAG: PAAR domain-containing protein [Telluria sp.]
MVMRAVICKDDPTSHGGIVAEGNEHATANGRPIAQKGHMTHCPQCRGNFPIVEGLGFHSFVGVGTAVEGMKTGCGAILIATTTKGFMMIDDCSEADVSAASVAAANKEAAQCAASCLRLELS